MTLNDNPIRSLEDVRQLIKSSLSALTAGERIVRQKVLDSNAPALERGYSVLEDLAAQESSLRMVEALVLSEHPLESNLGQDVLNDLRLTRSRISASASSIQEQISNLCSSQVPAAVQRDQQSFRSVLSTLLSSTPTKVRSFLVRGSDVCGFMERATYTNLPSSRGSIIPSLVFSFTRTSNGECFVNWSTIEEPISWATVGTKVSSSLSAVSHVSAALKADSMSITSRKLVAEDAFGILERIRHLSGRYGSWGVARMMSSVGSAGYLRLQSKAQAKDIFRNLKAFVRREYGPEKSSDETNCTWIIPSEVTRYLKIHLELDGEFVRAELLYMRNL